MEEKIEKEWSEEELIAESEELMELRLLTKDNAVFSRTEGGFVALDFDGKHYDRVGVYRAFPLTEEERFLSIREANEKAKEIGMVESLKDLPTDMADMLREQLKLRYFMPVIEKILSLKDEYGYAYFEAQTNFGVCRFTTGTGADSFVNLGDGRYLILDLDGNRYEIPDVEALSAQEKKKLDLFI